METDSFFYQLLKKLPETLFALLGEPLSRVAQYRFEAMEVKKSYRLDGLFMPKRRHLPIYFIEVQFRRSRRFYANLFGKVFTFLETNDPDQEWMAIALFANRACEPKSPRNYEALLTSRHVRRIYLNELSITGAVPPGLTILQLASSPEEKTADLVSQVLQEVEHEPDCERANVIVELVEEILIRRYHDLDREEIRRMFKLKDIRKTRVWQEAREEGRVEGREEGEQKGRQKGREEGLQEGEQKGRVLERQQTVRRLQAMGHSLKEIAKIMETSVAEIRRLAKG